jgi:HK97 family phage prohead protease
MEIKKDYIKNIENAERRFVVSELESKHEVRSIDNEEEDEYIITGYAAKYNSETDLGYIREVIMPNAFDEVLQDDVRALLNHDESSILGRTKSGTLRIWADGIGLGYEVKLDKRNTDHMNTYYSIQRGDISQSSFAFIVKEQSWEKGEQTNLRKIMKVERLFDVSPVTYPAYNDTSVASRSMAESIKDEMPQEDWEFESRKMKLQILKIK